MATHQGTAKSGILVSTTGVFGSALLWLLAFKAVACWMGPEGVGLFSQLRQMAQAATVGATFGGTNSIVQGLAERNEEASRREFRATAASLIGLSGAVLVLLVLMAAPQLTRFFLSSSEAKLVATVRWIALAVLLNVGGTYALAVLNGYRSYAYFALAQIAGPAAIALFLAAAWWWQVPADPQFLAGAFVLCFGLTCAVGAWGVSRLPALLEVAPSRIGLSIRQKRAFFRFALSNLFAALATTIALLLIRSWVIEANGLAFAGLFDVSWTLTFNYITLFLTACSAIYLPLLTAAISPESQKRCMLKTVYLVLGASVLICYAMVLWKEPLINLLYSPQFQASGSALMILAIAVIFRGASWVYGTMILATRSSRTLLASDITFNLSLLIAARFSLDNFGTLEALGWAFVLPNFLYLVFVVEYVRMRNALMRRRLVWPLLIAGTAPLIYLTLGPNGAPPHTAVPAVWICMAMGLAVSMCAFFAYKKVAL